MTIITKYLGATNSRGARIKATMEGTELSTTVPYPHELSGEACHREAVKKLLPTRGCTPYYFAVGELEHGYVYVSVPAREQDREATLIVI